MMKQKRNVALDCAVVCLALGAASIVGIPPASAEASSDNSPNMAPALKCADLTGWKVPGSTTIVTKAQEVPEAPPGTVQPSPSAPATVSVALPAACGTMKRIG
jgi:feruloyl esterase